MIGGDKTLRADKLKEPSQANRDDLIAAAGALVLCLASIAAVCTIMWLGT